MRITLKQIEVFVTVAREGTVLKAAERLNLTQSATSMALADCERQLGRQLFDRVGRRLAINDAGHQLLPRAIDLLARAEELEQMARQQSGLVGRLRIGASLTIGNYLIPGLIGSFLTSHPESQISLDVGNTTRIIQEIEKFHIDIGFIEGYCHSPDIEVLPWCEDELVVFASAQHPLSQKSCVDAEDLAAASWILRETGSGTREIFDNAVLGRLPQVRLLLELDHTEAIKRAVEAGMGLGCLSRISLQEALERGKLVELPTPFLDLRRQFYILVHRQKYRTEGLNAFLHHCQTNKP